MSSSGPRWNGTHLPPTPTGGIFSFQDHFSGPPTTAAPTTTTPTTAAPTTDTPTTAALTTDTDYGYTDYEKIMN